jgi:predicted dehydrogenase
MEKNLGAEEKIMTISKKLKVGIAGYGIVGKKRHHFIDANPHMQVVGVCDKTFTGKGIIHEGIRSYDNYKDLIDNEKLDVLFVCLTNDIAAEVTMAGLDNNIHVFCEKPPGKTPNDIKNVRNIESTKPNLKLKYGFNHRYHDSVKEALKMIESKELGEVINLRGVYGKSNIIAPNSEWRSKREIAGGGILLDQGIHMVDLMRLYAGEFKDYHSFVKNDYWNYDVEDNAYALMRSEKGIVAFLHSTATEWRHRFNLDITLTKGSIILSGILSGTKSYGQESLRIIYRGESDGGNPREQTTTYIKDNSWAEEINEFADAILSNKPIVSGSSLDALRTMEMVFKIYLADHEWANKFKIPTDL